MEIADVAPTVLYALDEPVPESMDGHVRGELFLPSVTGACRVRYQSAIPQVQCSGIPTSISKEEEEQMRDKLRGLGYIE